MTLIITTWQEALEKVVEPLAPEGTNKFVKRVRAKDLVADESQYATLTWDVFGTPIKSRRNADGTTTLEW